MLKEGKFGYKEAISLIVITITSKVFFTSPSAVTKLVGTAGWYMTLISAIVAALMFMFLYLVLKRFPGKNMMEINDIVLGKFAGSILTLIYCVFFLVIASVNMREFTEIIKVFVLTESPPSFIMAIFIISVVSIVFAGLETLVRYAKFLIYILGAGLIVVILLSVPNFRMHRLHPLLGNGLEKTIIHGALRCSFYGEAALLGIFAASLQGSKEIKKIGLYSIFISAVVTSLCLFSFGMVFPYTSARELASPMYAMAANVRLGEFLQHMEPIFVFLWNFSSFIEVAALFYGALMTYCHVFRITDKRPVVLPMGTLLFCLNLLPKGIQDVSSGYVQTLRTWGWVIYFLPAIFVLIIALIRKKKGGTIQNG
ncbi:MAG TPA: endospore germination permease [Clostridiaceae bacterium]|nr:endospore germination permease [Clostridiaceae bacterium]